MSAINSFKLMILIASYFLAPMVSGCTNKLSNPPPNLLLLDLAGTWTARYSSYEIDTITIDANGNFSQRYENTQREYIFNSDKNQLYLERTPKGVTRLHMPGGRYYLEGISVAEGETPPWGISFYDPFSDDLVKMVDKLILVLQLKPNNTLILHHLWITSDRGFLLFNADSEIFYRK